MNTFPHNEDIGDAGQDHGADGGRPRGMDEPLVVRRFGRVATVIHHAAAAPTASAAAVRQSQRPICLETSSAEATIKPKKTTRFPIG